MNVVLSPISIPDLVNQIANEIETRLYRRLDITPPQSQPHPIRLTGDKAAAAYLHCSVVSVQNLRNSGAIPFYRMGRKVYYLSTELDEALRVQNRKFKR